MRIAVNTRLLLKNKLEGIGRFTLELLSRIVKSHPEHEFYFLFDRPPAPKFLFSENVKPVVIGPQARHPFLYVLWFELSVPAALKKIRPDVFLSPDGFLSLRCRYPSIPVMHDLNFEHYPQDLPFFTRHYYRYFFPRFARKANHIVTVSKYSKEDIAKQYHIDRENISVVYNGVNEVYSPLDDTEKQKVREEYTGGNPYFVYVGALHQRKNLVNLFRAYDRFKSRSGSDVKLLIVGNKMWWTKAIRQAYERMINKEDVIFKGHMSTRELRRVYGAALALTYVSYFEGFGIPIIEAMACGVPVITSNVTSMPEVAGSSAAIVNPFEVDQITEAMGRIHRDKAFRELLIKGGQKQQQLFSWDRSAEKLWEIIEKTALEGQ